MKKKTWRTINETLSRKKFISVLPSTFLHNNLELINLYSTKHRNNLNI